MTAINVIGAPYYLAPIAVRLRHPLHTWLRPSGYLGQALGLLAVVLFLFLWLYPFRKKLGARISGLGTLAGWLEWHIAAGLFLPLVAATHAGWRFTGLIGVGYAAMFIVFLSGLIGRYLYAKIPRHKDGLELTRGEISAERQRLLFELTAETGLPPSEVRETLAQDGDDLKPAGIVHAIFRMFADDLARRRVARRLSTLVKESDPSSQPRTRESLYRAASLARREVALAQQVRMLSTSQRVLAYWHVAHRPVAVTALIAVLIHVVVAISVGATWLG